MEFVQERISTLHDFGNVDADISLDDVSVVVPIVGTDVRRQSVRHTLESLSQQNPGSIVLPIRGNRSEVDELDTLVEQFDLSGTIFWCNSPEIEQQLRSAGLDHDGTKGLDVWLGVGVAAAEADIVVVHDADATSYDGGHVARLAWPIAHGSSFAKGYYARVEDGRLFGRLTRLLWTPLLTALHAEGQPPILTYLRAFRYPLAGEFALTSDLARSARFSSSFGLEVGLLGEAFDLVGASGCAQVDLGWHRHDHRPIEGETGLASMARDIVGTIFDVLECHGVNIDPASIAGKYHETACEYVDQYAADAAFNGLRYDRTEEIAQVEQYGEAIEQPREPVWLPPIADSKVSIEQLYTGATGDKPDMSEHAR